MNFKSLESKASPYFRTVSINNIFNSRIDGLSTKDCTKEVIDNKDHLLKGDNILNGIPFVSGPEEGNDLLIVKDKPVSFELKESFYTSNPEKYNYIVFLHAVDNNNIDTDENGFAKSPGPASLFGKELGQYTITYSDGDSVVIPITLGMNIGSLTGTGWGENVYQCMPHTKPQSFLTNSHEHAIGNEPKMLWGESQFRTAPGGTDCKLTHWIYAAENKFPDKKIASINFTAKNESLFIFGITLSSLTINPIYRESARRVKVTLPEDMAKTETDIRKFLDIDLGSVIAVFPALDYDDANWETGYINKPPVVSLDNYIVEYTAHPDARLYFGEDQIDIRDIAASCISEDAKGCCDSLTDADLSKCEKNIDPVPFIKVNHPTVRVNIKLLDKYDKPVSAKLHIHGVYGEYLPPENRHRYPNPFWFEDYSVDYINYDHCAAYVDGNVRATLPVGDVFIEVSKGFECVPVKKRYVITPETETITIVIDHILPWRQRGWVSADTHVHFLSPHSALLEGSAEGVNIVNLLASQWGELFTNIGDFDGKTTLGEDGEYLVRVGTENRQPVMGHISLLGYEGDMILPLTTGGPSESRLGDAVETTLSAWAAQCRKQNGISILPHFPRPRGEPAASIVLDLIDGVEMTSWNRIFAGIDPLVLSDWYRYLNCGYQVPAVGGSDKMSAAMPVGGLRTYALIKDKQFTYDNWKQAVRSGLTFVSCGPLIDFQVGGQDAGGVITMSKTGGLLDINYQVSSVIIPVTKIQLIFNGKVVEMKEADATQIEKMQSDNAGSWSFNARESGWLALRVFAKFPDRDEIVAAHTSPVMIKVGDKPIYSSMDAMSILDEIEGVTVFIKTVATKGTERQYAAILSELTAAHRKLHNYMHANEVFHDHAHDYKHHDK